MKMSNRVVLRLQLMFFNLSENILFPGIETAVVPAGVAASIIFPRNNGNKLVVNADNAINTRLRINVLL